MHVHSGLVECNGQSEWELLSVVDNSQRVSLERMVSVEEARQEEDARDNVKTVKLEADGETDRVLIEKGNWRERDRAQMVVGCASVAQVPV